jgi:hypothetical protein
MIDRYPTKIAPVAHRPIGAHGYARNNLGFFLAKSDA